MINARSLAIVIGLSQSLGCASNHPNWMAALRSRAAFELDCAEQQLVIAPLTDKMTYGITRIPLYQGVRGCGRRAVYVATRSGYVLNSDILAGSGKSPVAGSTRVTVPARAAAAPSGAVLAAELVGNERLEFSEARGRIDVRLVTRDLARARCESMSLVTDGVTTTLSAAHRGLDDVWRMVAATIPDDALSALTSATEASVEICGFRHTLSLDLRSKLKR
jgi:hypothetical protein